MSRTATFISLRALIGIFFLCNTFLLHSQFGNSALSNEAKQFQKIDVSQTLPQRTIINSSTQEFQLEYQFNGFSKTELQRSQKTFDYLHITGFSKMGEIGNPALPAHNDVILLPGNGEAQIEITEAQYETLDGYYVHPAMEAGSDEAGSPEPTFEMNQNTYRTNAFFPQDIVKLIEVQKLRGTDFGIVQIRPIQYNPVTSQIRVYTSIRYKITFSGSKSAFNQLARSTSSESLSSYHGSFLNNNILPKHNTAKSSNGYNYIMICTDSYKSATDSLAKWKRQLGYTVEVISKSTWTSTEVKDSIHTRYHNWNIKPDYFVIIGDHEDVPAEIINYTSTTYYASDLYYACMDGAGDYVPEMAHGRIPANSASQAMMMVQKIINYERNPVSSASFYDKATVASYYQDGSNYTSYHDGNADRRYIHTCEEARDYMSTQGYTVDRVYQAYDNRTPLRYNPSYYSNGEYLPNELLRSNGFQWDGSAADMNNSINDGRFLFIHRDHGYTEGVGYAHPQYVTVLNHVNQLTNNDKLPVVFSINCHSGNYINNLYTGYSESLAENFIRKSGGGAVGVIAPSYTTWSGYNDAALIGMMDAIWSNPGILPNFGTGGTLNPSVNSHGDIRTMGDIMNQGLLRMTQTWASSSRWRMHYETYHYFGDPAMRLWTEAPQTISHNVPVTLERLTNVLNINCNVNSGIATLMINDTIYAMTDVINGDASFNLNTNQVCDAVLTISGENFRPVIQNIRIDNRILPDEPSIQASNINFQTVSKSPSLTVNWVNGDGDFRMVVMNTSGIFEDPVDGIEYAANNVYQNTGQQVVYNGNGSEVTVTDLEDNTTYWFRVYEYNNKGVYTLYTTFEEMNNPNNPDGNSTFPIELLDFSAKNHTKYISLAWSTATEFNNDYFTIEKSTDGVEFEAITQVEGAGNSYSIKRYNFDDYNVLEGTIYYRLQQTDYDGTSTYSSVIKVENKTNNELSIHKAYTNDHSIVLHLNLPQTTTYTLKVSDLNGKTVLTKHIENEVGSHIETIDSESLSSGVYLCTVQYNNGINSKKLIIQ